MDIMRVLKKLRANLTGYFWTPCPLCKEYFGGFEIGNGSVVMPDGKKKVVCKNCDYDAGIIEGMRKPTFISANIIDFLGI